MATTTYVPITTTTLTSNESTVSFSSFGGYTDLRVVANIKLTGTNGLYFKPNSDSSSVYSATTLYGNGSSATSSRLTTGDLGGTGMYIPGGTFSTLTFSVLQIDFMNYTNTNVYKTALVRYSTSDARVGTSVELFAKTDAITSLVFGCDGGGSIAAGSTFTLYGIANAQIEAPKATGGIITYDDTYFYHTFGASGTFTPQQSLTADILVVAGGGGGGRSDGAGGGAGGLLGFASQSLSATGYTVTVGAGGAGGNSGAVAGVNGGDSQFGALTLVKGGGGGAGWSSNGLTGGSGGGGGGYTSATTGGSATSGQGNAGGSNNPTSTVGQRNSGGGGGAGAVGGNGSASATGAGGNGSSAYSSYGLITGTGENVSGTVYYAGGGSGGADRSTAVTPGAAGFGGGGRGAFSSAGQPAAGSAGKPNTGGGGGGGASGEAPNNLDSDGGNGGSGVVIIRYLKA